jgi:hypothetical protein
MRLNNSEDTASKLVVSILDMESFFGYILSDSMIFNSFFNYTFICKKLVSELRRFGTTVELENYLSDLLEVKVDLVMKSALKPNIGKRILNEVKAL